MLGQMPSRLLSEWMAYASLEPFGPVREDYHAAQVVTMLANINRNPKVKSEPFVPGDFFATLVPEPEPEPDPLQHGDMLLEKMRMLFAPFTDLHDRETPAA